MDNLPTVRVPALATPLWDGSYMSDGFANFVSRLGVAGKAAGSTFIHGYFNRIEADAAYRGSWFGPVVDIPPFDEVREWRTWTGLDEDKINLIMETERRVGLRQKVMQARILARKDGGSAIYIGDGRNSAMPIDPEQIAKDGLKYLTVLTRDEIQPAEMVTDATDERFRQPKHYTIATAGAIKVHPSRVVRFVGKELIQTGVWDGWGESLWMSMRSAVLKADQIAAAIAEMVEEAKLDVMRIENLANNMATAEAEALLVRRFGLMGTLKSTINALLLDKGDEFEQKTMTFQGVPDIQNNALMVLSGMAQIPATRLLGRSPQGMNATGESDMRNYYDRVKATQTVDLQPLLAPLDEILIRSALGDRPDDANYEWNPLYQQTEKEAADIEKIFADAAKVYADTGVVPDTALISMVRGGIIERGQWPGAENAFDEADKEGDEPGLTAEPTEAELASEAAQIAIATETAKNPAAAIAPKPKLATKDASPRTLYVSRAVVNQAEIKKWAKAQGFASSTDDMHVTIAMSGAAIDWMKVPDSWSWGDKDGQVEIPPGGARIVEPLGGKGAVVLLFNSSDLAWRHRSIINAGASWDFPDYQPHITITYAGAGMDLTKVQPYRGKIVLGPEIWEDLRAGDIEHAES